MIDNQLMTKNTILANLKKIFTVCSLMVIGIFGLTSTLNFTTTIPAYAQTPPAGTDTNVPGKEVIEDGAKKLRGYAFLLGGGLLSAVAGLALIYCLIRIVTGLMGNNPQVVSKYLGYFFIALLCVAVGSYLILNLDKIK
jgi:hypothetical protein